MLITVTFVNLLQSARQHRATKMALSKAASDLYSQKPMADVLCFSCSSLSGIYDAGGSGMRPSCQVSPFHSEGVWQGHLLKGIAQEQGRGLGNLKREGWWCCRWSGWPLGRMNGICTRTRKAIGKQQMSLACDGFLLEVVIGRESR